VNCPICKRCAWATDLCPQCSHLKKTGTLSDSDVEVSRILHRINETHNISEAHLSRTIPFEGTMLLLTRSEPGILIGKGGKVVAAISAATGKKVRIIREGRDEKRMITDLILPARLLGINTRFHEGGQSLVLRVAKGDRHKLFVDALMIKSLIKDWLKKDIDIVFE